MTPTAPADSSESYIKFTHCLRIVFVIGEYAYIFQMAREFYTGKIFYGDGSFLGVDFSGKFYAGGRCRNSYMKFFVCLAFSLLTRRIGKEKA